MRAMTRVAAIDCGTNSLRLLVAELDPVSGTAEEIDRRTTIVRLGQDVDRTGEFAEAALERTFAVLREFGAELRDFRVERVRMVATSAARDVANRERFVAGVQQAIGVMPEVIGGDEEAALSYAGAAGALAGTDEVEEPIVVLDIGGGSTEFVVRHQSPTEDSNSIVGSADDFRWHDVVGQSLDIGSVRLTERHLKADPPTPDQVRAAEADVITAMQALALPVQKPGTLIGVAGTVTTMAAMVLGLDHYDRDVIDGSRLPAVDVDAAVAMILEMTVAERRALPFMHPDRADVIGGGAIVLGLAMRLLVADALVVSEHDILDGIAWSLV